MPAPPAPRLLYLHGLASGPDSKKGLAVSERLAARGLAVERLDLRVPSPETLSFPRMCEVVVSAMNETQQEAQQKAQQVVLLGSSMGGLVAARVAEREPRVGALVLMAPAVRFAERWKAHLGAAGWERWMQSGWLETPEYASRGMARLHAQLGRELEALDVGLPELRVPTLILHGIRDEIVPISGSRELARDRPHVQLVEVDDGHDLLVVLPVLLDEIEAFLGRILPTLS